MRAIFRGNAGGFAWILWPVVRGISPLDANSGFPDPPPADYGAFPIRIRPRESGPKSVLTVARRISGALESRGSST